MSASLRREVADAVVLGLAAMWGTGLFVVFAPAAALAGGWLPLAVVTAAMVALAAGFAEADLAVRHPGAGGGYRYARERLPPGLARLTGVAGLSGRITSAAAAALVFGDYVLPAHPVCVAVPLIAVLGGLTASGVRWSVRSAWVLVPGLLFVLTAFVVTGLTRQVPAEWSATGLGSAEVADRAGPAGRLGAAQGPAGAVSEVPAGDLAGPAGPPVEVPTPDDASRDRLVAPVPGQAGGPGVRTPDPTAEPVPDATGPPGRPAPATPAGVLGAAGLMFFAFLGFSAVPSAVPSTGPSPGSWTGPSTGPSPGSWTGPSTGPSPGSSPGSWTGPSPGPSTGPSAASRPLPSPAPHSRAALPAAVLAALVSYLAVALALAHTLGASRVAAEAAPLVAGVGGGDAPALGVLVRVGAAAATGCALFAMLSGAGGTAAAMATHNDLPGRLGLLGSRGRPWQADLAVVALTVLLAALVTPVAAVAVSACAALVHYALVGLASLRLSPGERRWPRWTAVLTPPLCLGLALFLPRPESVAAVVALAVGWVLSTVGARRTG